MELGAGLARNRESNRTNQHNAHLLDLQIAASNRLDVVDRLATLPNDGSNNLVGDGNCDTIFGASGAILAYIVLRWRSGRGRNLGSGPIIVLRNNELANN